MSKLLRGSTSRDSYLYSDDDLTKNEWQSMCTYIYNSKKKTCCKRTCKQWTIMVFYYLTYTAFLMGLLLGFLYGCWFVVQLTTDKFPLIDKTFLVDDPFPGLGFVPNIVHTKHPIIWYSPDPDEQMSEKRYVLALDTFFGKYKEADREKYADCESGKNGSKPCYFDLNKLEDCNVDGYQYTNDSLCFFMKLNRLIDWTPVYYQQENDIPDTYSEHVKHRILDSSEQEVIYVECVGRRFWDNDHMGNITYYPQQGFNGYYFPYKGESDYLPPLIAVKLSEITTGVVIQIKCKLFLRNIDDRLGFLYVKIFVDNTLHY